MRQSLSAQKDTALNDEDCSFMSDSSYLRDCSQNQTKKLNANYRLLRKTHFVACKRNHL